jgi:hypothetical protein
LFIKMTKALRAGNRSASAFVKSVPTCHFTGFQRGTL